MNTPAPGQPRFTCRLARGCLAMFGETTGGTPRGPGAGHVAHCPDCQAYFAACDEFDLALRRDAARAWQEAPSNLEQKILRAVRQSAATSAARAPRASALGGAKGWRGVGFSLAGAAACAALALLVYQQPRPPAGAQPSALSPAPALSRVEGPVAANVGDPAMLTAAKQLLAAVPTDLFAEMQPKAQALLQQDPLQTEVEAMKADAQRAVRFLARNFLPTAPDQPASGE